MAGTAIPSSGASRTAPLPAKPRPKTPRRATRSSIWRQGEIGDFELRLKFHIVGGNSGIQYRARKSKSGSSPATRPTLSGDGSWTGTLYEERGRGILAKRGEKVEISSTGDKKNAGPTTAESDILAKYKKGEWNDYEVIAQGNHLIQKVNGDVTVDVTDHQKEKAAASGLLALQLHAGPPMIVQFKEIQLKRTNKPQGDANGQAAKSGEKKKVVFLAGRASHGYGSHEHYAGWRDWPKSCKTPCPTSRSKFTATAGPKTRPRSTMPTAW